MNYRHAFHAGNHADVLKHGVEPDLRPAVAQGGPVRLPRQPRRRRPLRPAGDQASRTGEWLQGIARIWQAETRPALLDDYLGVIRSLNPDGALRYYPGSPELARQLTREQDRLQLNEKHPEDGALLQDNMSGDRRVAVHRGEGWHVPRALMPTREKRVVLLIDPPFEQADELSRCVTALKEALGRMRQTIGVIWYPIRTSASSNALSGPRPQRRPKLLRAELFVHPADDASRLAGSGLAIVNPPWGWRMNCESCCHWLAEQLAQSQGGWRLDWLIEEA